MMKFNGRSLAAMSIAALSLASVLPISTAQAQSTTTVAVADVNLNAPRFVQRIGSLNIFLINSSKMALQRSQNEAVRGFAQRLIEHHSAMQHDLAVVNNSNVGGSMPSSMISQSCRRILTFSSEACYTAALQSLSGYELAIVLPRGSKNS